MVILSFAHHRASQNPSFTCRIESNMSRFYTVLSRKCAPRVPQGHLREGKCHLLLGNAMAASRCFQKVLELEPSNREAQQEVEITWTLHIVSLQLNLVNCHYKGSANKWFLYFRIRPQRPYWSSNEWRILALKSGISERFFTPILLNHQTHKQYCTILVDLSCDQLVLQYKQHLWHHNVIYEYTLVCKSLHI